MTALRHAPTVAVVLWVAAGCSTTIATRDLRTEPLDREPMEMAPRGCSLYVEQPIDARPLYEREGGEHRRTRELVPLIPLFWWQSSESVTLHDPRSFKGDGFLHDLGEGIRATLRNAGTCDVAPTHAGADLVLESKVLHFYGVNYEETSRGASLGAYAHGWAVTYPAGQFSLQITLRRAANGEIVVRRDLTETAIFDPGFPGASRVTRGVWKWATYESNRSIVAIEAVRRLYRVLPAILDREVALAGYEPSSPRVPETFMITRQLQDYDRVEHAVVETSTGRVRSSQVLQRRTPVIGRPGEWMLTPYQPSYLPPVRYRDFVAKLRPRYEVRFEQNLTAARFYGLRNSVVRSRKF